MTRIMIKRHKSNGDETVGRVFTGGQKDGGSQPNRVPSGREQVTGIEFGM